MADFLMVSGFHRGGTSVCAKICADIGLLPGFSMLGSSQENPTGFYEHLAVLRANQSALDEAKSARWLYPTSITKIEPFFVKAALATLKTEGTQFCKDPRFLNTASLWLPRFSKSFGQTRILISLRHPEAVAKSIEKRDGIPVALTYFWMLSLLWNFIHSIRYFPHEILFVDFEKTFFYKKRLKKRYKRMFFFKRSFKKTLICFYAF